MVPPPLASDINWRLAILLFALCVVFTVLTTLVVRKTYGMQNEVEAHYSDLSARASDALGNVALVQSFVRIDAEVQGLRFVADKLLAVQMPVLSWWALVTVITRASTTITVLAIFTVGIALHAQGLTTVGEIVMFVATMLIQSLNRWSPSSTTCSWKCSACRNSSTCWMRCWFTTGPMRSIRDDFRALRRIHRRVVFI